MKKYLVKITFKNKTTTTFILKRKNLKDCRVAVLPHKYSEDEYYFLELTDDFGKEQMFIYKLKEVLSVEIKEFDI